MIRKECYRLTHPLSKIFGYATASQALDERQQTRSESVCYCILYTVTADMLCGCILNVLAPLLDPRIKTTWHAAGERPGRDSARTAKLLLRQSSAHTVNLYLKRRVVNVSCSSTACDWTTGRKRSQPSHSDSTQLTDKYAVSHSSGDVIVESALRSCKARSSSL